MLERIFPIQMKRYLQAKASELTSYEGQALSVVCAYNENARPAFSTHGIPDERIYPWKSTYDKGRGAKRFPFQASPSGGFHLLRCRCRNRFCFCGNGSSGRSGTGFAVEKKEDAVALLYENKQKFAADNLEIIKGEAPEALRELPVPTHAFIGGSSGNLKEIVALLLEKTGMCGL